MKKLIHNYVVHRLYFLFLFFITLIQGCSEPREPYYFLEIDIAGQNQERRFIEPYSDLIFSETDFFNPMRLEVSKDGFFVLDVSDDAITRRYSWDFELVNRIGRGRGTGPGEIGGVNDIHLSGDMLYIADAANGLIHQFSIDNLFLGSISIDGEVAMQVTILGDRLALRTIIGETPLFADFDGTPIRKAEVISSDEIRYTQILQSQLFSDDEYLYRLPIHFGFMLKYDKHGSLITARHLVDAYAPSFDDRTRNPLQQPVGISDDEMEIVSVTAALFEDTICVQRLYRFDERRLFIDCYDTSDLAYQFSFIPPEGTRDFAIYGGHFAAIHDSSLTVWEWGGEMNDSVSP